MAAKFKYRLYLICIDKGNKEGMSFGFNTRDLTKRIVLSKAKFVRFISCYSTDIQGLIIYSND